MVEVAEVVEDSGQQRTENVVYWTPEEIEECNHTTADDRNLLGYNVTATIEDMLTASYRGPAENFPFTAFHILGATHILVSIAMIVVGVIHVALSATDRELFLMSGSVAIWCPMAGLATGIVAAAMSDSRHWEVQCLKNTFLALSLVTAFCFMVPLALVTGFVDFYYYHVSQITPLEMLGQRMTMKDDNRVALMWVIVAMACLEFLICILSACVCCCCAPLYQEADVGMPTQEQIVIKQQAPPPVYVEKPAPQTPIVIQAPQQRPQPPIILQAPPQRAAQPIIVQAPPRPALPMLMPPQQPIYASPSYMSVRRTMRS